MSRKRPDDAFRKFVAIYEVPLYRYVLSRLPPAARDSADDTLAEVFVVAWRKWDDRPPEDSDEFFWLLAIARRALSNRRRSLFRWQRLHFRISSEPMPSPDPAVSDDAVHLRRTIARLSADDQEALRLVYWERLSCREIGRVLGCSEKAVGIRLSRARQRLARLLVDIPDAPIVPSPAREALP